MVQISPIGNYSNISSRAYNQNAVQLKDNGPVISRAAYKTNPNGENNTISINVGIPEHNNIYSYPMADKIGAYPQTVYYTYIVNNNLVRADVEFEQKGNKYCKPHGVKVPEPNVVELDSNKSKNITFGSLADIKIYDDAGIKPGVNIDKVLQNLNSTNYDTQALQMEEIAKLAIDNDEKVVPYINSDIYTALIDIVNKNTRFLDGPTMEQITIRKKIIANAIYAEQSVAMGEDPQKMELPYEISSEDIKKANVLSPLELAERNKEYGLYTLAALSNSYATAIEKQTGNVVPLADLPGISVIVDVLKNNNNPSIKIAAINALMYIQRPEYNEEIKSVMEVVSSSYQDGIGRHAKAALDLIN